MFRRLGFSVRWVVYSLGILFIFFSWVKIVVIDSFLLWWSVNFRFVGR